jgi:cytidyltransferase-like protein
MKKVLVFGAFDGIHAGHRFFIREAKSRGDFLTVVVARDSTILKLKGRLPSMPVQNRIMELRKEELADEIVAGDEVIGRWGAVLKSKPDVICLGYDQTELGQALRLAAREFSFPVAIVELPSYNGDKLHSRLLNNRSGQNYRDRQV